MSTHTNVIRPESKFDRNTVLTVVIVALVLAAAIVLGVTVINQPVAVAESSPAVSYSNALEMQYAQPFIDAQNKPVAAYGNALEMQYAQPWIQNTDLFIAVTGGLACHSNLEILHACNAKYGRP